MNINELAVIAGRLGGTQEAALALGVGEDLLTRAIAGEQLDRLERGEIESSVYEFLNDNLNFTVESETSALDFTVNYMDVDQSRAFREAVATGAIDTDDLQMAMAIFPATLTDSQSGKILNLIQDELEQGKVNDLADKMRDMFDAFEADGWDILGDISESEFWAWFRETFYE